MKLHFQGAIRNVTGSCYLVETPSGLLMIDCGMYQGGRALEELNRRPFAFDPTDVKWVILTHAHIDHSGLVPRLVKLGYPGNVIAHPATCDLADIMLRDSAHIQEEDAAFELKKHRRGQLPAAPSEPLYTVADAEVAATRLRPVPYGEIVQLSENVRFRLVDAGHILGSANVELWLREADRQTRLTFSGDIGSGDSPILRQPEALSGTDFLVMESTYGDRLHEARALRLDRLRQVIARALQQKGCVVIPSFAVGRTQEVVYSMNELVEGRQLPATTTYVDSPLALNATQVFRKHPECYNQALRQDIAAGDDPFDFPYLRFTRTVDDSKAINTALAPYVVLSAAGMCNAGRIRHHLLHHLGRREDTILFVGFQARNTLGRRIQEGVSPVRIMGEEVAVKASVEVIEGFSAHADRDGLLAWFARLPQPPALTFATHGESPASFALRDALGERFQAPALVPEPGQIVDLIPGSAELAAQVEAQRTRTSAPSEPQDEDLTDENA